MHKTVLSRPQDSEDRLIGVDKTSIRHFRVGCLVNVDLRVFAIWDSGPRLNIKTVLSTYGDFHAKDKTAVRTSYL